MGIYCEINLFKPPDGAYKPGQVVSGLIKYALDEPMECEKITTSLKGSGSVVIKVKRNKKNRRYRSSEVYVDVDNVIQDEKNVIPVGSYEIKFNFILPPNVPSSLHIYKRLARGTANCRIKYYVRIKFERPGFFALNKHFHKEIILISEPQATLPTEPVIYGERKKLTQLFSSKNSIINVKATILNSAVSKGGKLEMNYEVENDSNVVVKSVETQLIEVYHFIASGYDTECENVVPDTDAKAGSINCGDTQNMPVQINIPSDIQSLENSDVVTRKYIVKLEVALPFPHWNIILNVPVQLGVVNENVTECYLERTVEEINYNEPPPSYWETMGEANEADKNKDDCSDGEIGVEK